MVKTRYAAKEISATVTCVDEKRFKVNLDLDVFAITPGQIAAVYSQDGEELFGGGVIL